MWKLQYSKQAKKDYKNIKQSHLSDKLVKLLLVLEENPFKNPPEYEKLEGADNIFSRRINAKHRLVYEVKYSEHVVFVIKMWGHYDDN